MAPPQKNGTFTKRLSKNVITRKQTTCKQTNTKSRIIFMSDLIKVPSEA